MSKNLNDLRTVLFETIEAVKAGTMDVERARTINDVGKSLIETARVEVDYLRASGGGESAFIDTAIGTSNLPPGVTGVTRHRIK